MWLIEDLDFWNSAEKEVKEMFELYWRKVIVQNPTSILDFKIIDKNWNEVFIEIKTRRNEKDKYEDTMIWLNKLIEAYKRYNDSWIYTLFVFKFTDWIFIINPFLVLPRFDFRRGRYDRGNIDKVKWWCYYRTEILKKFI